MKAKLDRVALLLSPHMHFRLIIEGRKNKEHQLSDGKAFQSDSNSSGESYVVQVCFTARTYGSYRQWIAFDLGDRPVLVQKLLVDVTKELREIRNLRFNLTCKRYISPFFLYLLKSVSLSDQPGDTVHHNSQPNYSDQRTTPISSTVTHSNLFWEELSILYSVSLYVMWRLTTAICHYRPLERGKAGTHFSNYPL
jgi:hypothetical protein